MDTAHENRRRWQVAGEAVFWVVCYFWAVWLLNALLPPQPAVTPFDALVNSQLGQQVSGHSSTQGRSAEAENLSPMPR